MKSTAKKLKLNAETAKPQWRTLVAWACVAVGAVILFVGWLGVSGETQVEKQLPFLISGGLGGLGFLGVGVALLVAEDVRAERARVGRLEAELLEVRDLLRRLVNERDARV